MALDDNTVDSDTTFKRDVDVEGEIVDRPRIYVQDTEPTNPNEGEIWIDTS